MRLSILDNDDTLGIDLVGMVTGVIGPAGSAGGVIGPQIGGQAGGQIGGSNTTFPAGGISAGASGQLASGRRSVQLSVKGYFKTSAFTTNEQAVLTNLLNSKGWQVSQATQVSTNIGGIGERQFSVVVNAPNTLTESEIVDRVRNDLQAIMSTTSVQVVAMGSSGSSSFGLPAGLDTALAPIALGLGISTATLLIGGGLVLVLLLRRR